MPGCLDASLNHKLINHTWADCQDIFLKSTVFLWEGWGQGKGTVSVYKGSWEIWGRGLGQGCPCFLKLEVVTFRPSRWTLSCSKHFSTKVCISYFSHCCEEILMENKIMGEAFAFLVVSEFQSVLVAKAWWNSQWRDHVAGVFSHLSIRWEIDKAGGRYNLQRITPSNFYQLKPTSQSFYNISRQCHQLGITYLNAQACGGRFPFNYNKCFPCHLSPHCCLIGHLGTW